MKITETRLPEVLLIKPDVFGDSRGYFMESWNQECYKALGLDCNFVQDNLSFSHKGTLRGLHFQNPNPQGKLVSVLQGEVFDVAVDVRVNSPSFAQWVGLTLSSENHYQLFIPEGFAHGFCVLSDTALFAYKCTQGYRPQAEHSIHWNDSDLAIHWPIENPEISDKDTEAQNLRDISDKLLP